ncbi:MAG: hypothetical protein JWM39_392 [Parcubacteria group bacterium]|nr:hypothetical protein [Parcubacteria group bacterium]
MRLFLTTILAGIALSASASAQVVPPIIIVTPMPLVSAPNPRQVPIEGTDLIVRSSTGLTYDHRQYLRHLSASCLKQVGHMQPDPIGPWDGGQALDLCVRLDFRLAVQMHDLPANVHLEKDPHTVSPLMVRLK